MAVQLRPWSRRGELRRRRLSFERLEDRQLLSLTHHYTFNDGLANDWVGNAHATLFNGAAVVDGQLVLNNVGITSGQTALVQHARLGANILSGSDATVAAWFTTSSAADWSRVFDIGSQTGGVGNSYLAFTPQSVFGDSRAIFLATGGAEKVASGVTVDDGVEHMAAVVIDSAAGVMRLYLDGTEVGTAALDGASAASVNDSLAYLGRSLFNADAGFTGSINEIRIYDDARSAEDIAADAAAGPSNATQSSLVRQMEYLNRGIVVVRNSSTSAYVGWRLLGTDPADVAFNLYRSTNNGPAVRLNGVPLNASTNFVDTTANLTQTNSYFVRAVVGGVEQDPSERFTLAANTPVRLYLNVPIQQPPGGVVSLPPGTQTPPLTPPEGGPAPLDYTYVANDTSVGDLDGDGQYEIILKWDPTNSRDNAHEGLTGPVIMDAYKLDGTLLWRINLGKNIRAGAHYTQFLVYDFDGDGRAEVVMKTADGTVDGVGQVIGNADADWRDGYTGSGDGRWGRVLSGPEYLTVFNGVTGAAMSTINFSPERGSVSSWGDSYGNRVDRFLAAVAYLDGERPSIVMARGYYAKTRLTAYDWRDGQLTQRWAFDSTTGGNGAYGGQGNHNLSVADVDNDGKDEIIYGASAYDDNGQGLYSTGWGHGDALHVSDMIPSRPGLEVFKVNESPSSYAPAGGAVVFDARTGELIFGVPANNDVGRGVAADIDPNHPGFEYWATTTDPNGGSRKVYNSAGQPIYDTPGNMFYNFLAYWDADLTRELLDGTTISEWNNPGRANFDLDPATGGTQTAPGGSSNNGSKSTPALSGDILGDWREEVIWRRSDNTALMIFTTAIPANNRLVTLMHDEKYRLDIAWQNVAYNQPPHPSFYIGPGMATPPTPLINPVQFSTGLPGDFNNDYRVDAIDYTVWRNHFGYLSDSALNLNGDGVEGVDEGDYLVWKQHYGQEFQPGGGGLGSGGLAISDPVAPGGDAAADLSSLSPLSSTDELAKGSRVSSFSAAFGLNSSASFGRASVEDQVFGPFAFETSTSDASLLLVVSRREGAQVDPDTGSVSLHGGLSSVETGSPDARDAALESFEQHWEAIGLL